MVEQVGHLMVSVALPQVNLVANKDYRHFIIDLGNACHPVSLKPTYAIHVVYIIHENDHVGMFNLSVSVLLVQLARAAVDQLGVHV